MMLEVDKIIFTPSDVDLSYSPVKADLNTDTYVLGAFNPGLCRLPNGNLMIMVRVAEALVDPIEDNNYKAIRWQSKTGYIIDRLPLNEIDTTDPRKCAIKYYKNKTYCLTSSSWLLPVELTSDGQKIIKIHYDKIIKPENEYQEFGVEDARITKIEDTYYMTACAVSSQRHSTVLYSSIDGLSYKLKGIIFDHQNKDVVLFPKKINGLYYALTRPSGDHYFASDFVSKSIPGPSINMAQSPDLMHWKPVENFTLQPQKNSMISSKIGGGAPPIEVGDGWLVIYHGVEENNNVGIYRTFSCLLDKEEPWNVLKQDLRDPLLQSDPKLTSDAKYKTYVAEVVFTSGAEIYNDNVILASGENDLCCRITYLKK